MSFTPLMLAARDGKVVDLVENLRFAGKKTAKGWTALMLAAQRSHAECIKKLLDVEGRLQDEAGWTALMHAMEHDSIECAALLLFEAGLRTTRDQATLPAGSTALMLATMHGYMSIVQLLIPFEIGMQNTNGQKAVWFASEYGHSDIALALATEREKNQIATLLPLTRDPTDLMRAAIAGDMKGVKKYIHEAGQQDEDGVTALMRASERGHFEIAKHLTSKEAGMQDRHGTTARMLAARSGYGKIVHLLDNYESGKKDERGNTACDYALSTDQLSIAQKLIVE